MSVERQSAMDDRDATQLSRGLPAGRLRERRLEYDMVSDTLVLSVVPEGKGMLPQVYLRRLSREEFHTPVVNIFRPVLGRAEKNDVVIRSWLLTQSSLFCVVGEVEATTQERVRLFNDIGLVRVDLLSRTCDL